jgi:hypothetical protein
MKNLRGLFLLFILLSSTSWAVTPLLKNDREGNSALIKKRHKVRIKSLLNEVKQEKLNSIFDESLREFNPKTICAPNLVNKVATAVKASSSIKFYKKHKEAVFQNMRQQNFINDLVLQNILFAADLKSPSKRILRKNLKKKLKKKLAKSEVTPKEILRKFVSFSQKDNSDACIIESFKTLHREVKGESKKLKRRTFKLMIDYALSTETITKEQYKKIEIARVNHYEELKMTISEFLKKKLRLRRQYPLLIEGTSNFITEKPKKSKVSYRSKLYQQYDYLQIVMMGDVIQSLRRRMDSSKIEILIFNSELDVDDVERIVLDPMERFRFSLKILRKEMHDLRTNSFFEGRRPSYQDLIVAAFELGMIPAIEVDEVASLEEIWNPKKTFMEKASVWIRLVSSVASIVIPPPYGFVPMLALVAIEATTSKGKKPELDHSLF